MSKTTINIDTDIDETLKKVEELIANCEELGDKGKQLHFLTVKDVANILRLFNKDKSRYFQVAEFCFHKKKKKVRLY